MFCAVKAIDREERGTVRCFQYTFDFYLGQISVTEAILVHCGVAVPPIHNTGSWQTFTELCCLVCQHILHQRHCKEDITVLKHCPSTCEKRLMWVGVGAGVGVGVGVDFSKPESESESESLKFGRLRSPACKYEYQCFVTIIQVKVISDHPEMTFLVKKVKLQRLWICHCNTCF